MKQWKVEIANGVTHQLKQSPTYTQGYFGALMFTLWITFLTIIVGVTDMITEKMYLWIIDPCERICTHHMAKVGVRKVGVDKVGV